MNIIEPHVELWTPITYDLLIQIEKTGRTCYKSGDRSPFTPESAAKFVAMLINRGHEAMLEHAFATVKFVCDRGVSHEIVRHRLAAYAQESTRYCNYSKDKFGNEITYIVPFAFAYAFKESDHSPTYCCCIQCQLWDLWFAHMKHGEDTYLKMLDLGAKPEWARTVLSNSLKTEIVCTYNLREWRHFFKMRTSKYAHPQMREIAIPLYFEFKSALPDLVSDIIVGSECYEDIPFAEVYHVYDRLEVLNSDPERYCDKVPY